MTPLYAGLMCTLLLSGTVAGLFGCMSAVRCHRPFVFAICLTIVSLDLQHWPCCFPGCRKARRSRLRRGRLRRCSSRCSAFLHCFYCGAKQAAAFAGFHQGKL